MPTAVIQTRHSTLARPRAARARTAVRWATLAVVFVTVYAAALLTTLAPALRASRIYPAEALRYE